MKLLTSVLKNLPEYRSLLAAIDGGRCPAAVSGLSPVHRAHFAAALLADTGRPVVLVCADESEGKRLGEDLAAFTGQQPLSLGAREFLFHPGAVASRQWEHRRLAAFHAMAEGSAPLVVATIEALLQRTLPPELFHRGCRTLKSDGQYDLAELAEFLAAAGYKRCQQVEGVGQFALRGGILDVYSPAQDHPVRIEFWDTDVDSMGLFDVGSQRRVARLDRAVFLPVSEALPTRDENGQWQRTPDRLLPARYQRLTTAAHHLPAGAVVCFSESGRVAERAKNCPRQTIGITHADDPAAAETMRQMLHARLPECDFLVEEIGAVLGVHLGIGGVGAFFFRDM